MNYFIPEYVTMRNIYHNRYDKFRFIDFLFNNWNQQQAFEITLSDGSKSFGQIGHYIS